MWNWSRHPRTRPETDASPVAAESAPSEPTDEELLARVADMAVARNLTVPAILFLESSKPLAFIGSQFLVFMEPFVKTFITAGLYDRFTQLMEDRENVERLIREIERQEAARPAAVDRDKSKGGG